MNIVVSVKSLLKSNSSNVVMKLLMNMLPYLNNSNIKTILADI